MFASVEEVQEQFRASRYIASRRIATVVYLASRMNRPVLVEGPAGVGKTELAKVLAETTGRPLVRLQCYEGLDEAKALYEWKYAKQLLYTQMLRERIGELIADAPSLPDAVDRIARPSRVRFTNSCRATMRLTDTAITNTLIAPMLRSPIWIRAFGGMTCGVLTGEGP